MLDISFFDIVRKRYCYTCRILNVFKLISTLKIVTIKNIILGIQSRPHRKCDVDVCLNYTQ